MRLVDFGETVMNETANGVWFLFTLYTCIVATQTKSVSNKEKTLFTGTLTALYSNVVILLCSTKARIIVFKFVME